MRESVPVYRLLSLRVRRSWGFRATLALATLVTLGCLIFLSFARGTHAGAESGALHALPNLFAQIICWGIATLSIFATGQRAFLRDHEDGIRGILRSRGLDRRYGLSRLVAAISSAAWISVLFTSILAVACGLAATGTSEVVETWKSAGSAIVYSALYSVLLGSIALAVLGGRGRGGGYVGLLTVLVLPELLEPLTTRAIPAPFEHIVPTSLPAILNAVAHPVTTMHFIAGIGTSVIVLGLAVTYTKRECARVDREADDDA